MINKIPLIKYLLFCIINLKLIKVNLQYVVIIHHISIVIIPFLIDNLGLNFFNNTNSNNNSNADYQVNACEINHRIVQLIQTN